MSKAGTVLVSFIFGAAAGSFVTYKYLNDTYNKLAQKEIDEIKEHYSRKNAVANNSEDISNVSNDEADRKAAMAKEKPSISSYMNIVKKEGYTDYSNTSSEDDENNDILPYVISPNDFGEEDGYDTMNFTYYADGVVADETNHVVENANDILGEDFETHFGEYEDDSVFIRNPNTMVDYEILSDYRTYKEILKENPNLMED